MAKTVFNREDIDFTKEPMFFGEGQNVQRYDVFKYPQFDKLNQTIVSVFHMINVYNHNEPVNDTFSGIHETHRISTIGISDLKDGEPKLFFPLKKISDMRYYYAINKQRLRTDGKLFAKIKKQVTERAEEELKTSYGIFSTSYNNDYVYMVCSTPIIQGPEPEDEKK